jgi:uncharacterized membrane protein (DUF485 family)
MPDAADPHHQDHPTIITRNARYGMVLFVIYLLIYAGFVALSVYSPGLMSKAVVGGVNLAIVYGMALIGIALVLAVIYMYLCRATAGGGAR